MTIDDFISANEELVLDLISGALPDEYDLGARAVWNVDHRREEIVNVMKMLYEWYIYGDDKYLYCKYQR